MVLPDERDENPLRGAESWATSASSCTAPNDGGESWDECGAPSFPTRDRKNRARRRHTDRRLRYTRSGHSRPGGPDEPNLLWAGTIPGALFRSNDRGTSWSLIETLWNRPERKKWFGGGCDDPGIHSDRRRSPRLQACDGRRLVRRCVGNSADGGEVLEGLQTSGMHAAYDAAGSQGRPRHPGSAQAGRLSCGAGRLVGSTPQRRLSARPTAPRAGPKSQDIKPSNFGFAVAVHPDDPETAWFVPAVKDEHRIPEDVERSWRRGLATGARVSRCCAKACPRSTPTIWSFVTRWTSIPSDEILAMGSTTGKPVDLRERGRQLADRFDTTCRRSTRSVSPRADSLSPRSVRGPHARGGASCGCPGGCDTISSRPYLY